MHHCRKPATILALALPLLAACSPAGRSAMSVASPPAPRPSPEGVTVSSEAPLRDFHGTPILEAPPSPLRPTPLEASFPEDRTAPPELRLSIELHDRVLQRLDYYTQGAGRSTIEIGLEQAALYEPMMKRILAEERVPQDLLHLAQAESVFKPEAVSRARARGMWQFMASRGEEYGLRRNEWIDERSDPEKSTRAAARHLRHLYEQFGDWYLAMAAYNAGPGRVSRAVKASGSSDFWTLAEMRLLPRETRDYVPTILAMALIGRNPEEFGFAAVNGVDGVNGDAGKDGDAGSVERVRIRQATDLRVIADRLELPLDELQRLNPHVLGWATPPNDDEFELRLPTGYAGAFVDRVSTLSEDERVLVRYHTVAEGETLSLLAGRYDVSVSAITAVNALPDAHKIRIGQSLAIPLSGAGPETTLQAYAEVRRPPETPPEVYRIRRGDTLSDIAIRFGLSIEEVRSWNGMSSDTLIAGRSLRLRAPPDAAPIPAPALGASDAVVYQVRPGDTLTRIAVSYETSVEALREWNQDSDLSIIHPGDEITIFTQR